jgi:hypothetical protein
MTTSKTVLSSLAICAALGLHAASPSIGFVAAKGSFQLDNSKVWSNATLFDGSIVETNAVPSQIHLSNGSDIQVAAQSRVRVFLGRTLLEKGTVQMQSSTEYQVEARALHLAAAASNTVAIVELRGNGRVAASASSGEILITNKDKVLVAKVTPGNIVTLEPDNANRPGLTRITGCVQGERHSLLLIDRVSGVAFELRGEGVEKELGNQVAIIGTGDSSAPKVAGASQAIKVTHVDRLAAGGCKDTGTTARRLGPVGAVAAAAAGAGAGLSAAVGTAGAVAIIGGVAVAATAGGLAAAGTFAPAQADSQPATSR